MSLIIQYTYFGSSYILHHEVLCTVACHNNKEFAVDTHIYDHNKSLIFAWRDQYRLRKLQPTVKLQNK